MTFKNLKDSWLFFAKHFLTIAVIVLSVIIPLEILNHYYIQAYLGDYFAQMNDGQATTIPDFPFKDFLPLIAINIIAYTLFAIAITFYISAKKSKINIDISSLCTLSLKYFIPYVFMSFLVMIAIIFGMILFIIPAFIFWARYSFSGFNILLGQDSPIAAMSNSWNSTKPYMWAIIRGFLVITIAINVPAQIIIGMFENIEMPYITIETILNSILVIFNTLYIIFSYHMYLLANQSKRYPTGQE